MNLRVHKKLSLRAASLLERLGYFHHGVVAYSAQKDKSYLSTLISDRTDWERRRCHPDYEPRNDYLTGRGREIKLTTRAGHTIIMAPPSCVRKGTVMVGSMSGGEEPEWSEHSAWEVLGEVVYYHFTEWDNKNQELIATKVFSTPSEILSAAEMMISKGYRS